MLDAILKILGLDTARIPPGAQTELVWQNWPGPWMAWLLLLCLGLLVAAIIWMYRREAGHIPLRVRLALAGLRIGVMLILAVVYLSPALGIFQNKTIRPAVIVLLDDSASMSVADRYSDQTAADQIASQLGIALPQLRSQGIARQDLVRHVLAQDAAGFFRELSQRGSLRVLRFSDQTVPVNVSADPLLTGQGPTTDIAKAVRAALREAGGAPIAGIVCISDGQATAGDDPLSAAEQAAFARAPLFVIGVGDASPPRNIAVTEVWARETVWRGDGFEVEAHLRQQGLAGEHIQVGLWERKADEPESAARELSRQTIQLDPNADAVSVNFRHTPREAGRFAYAVKAEPHSGEVVTSDNTGPVALVDVVEDAARVLLIAGGPGWDYQMVRNLWLRESSVKLSCWVQSLPPQLPQEGTLRIEILPRTAEELAIYDLIVLMDVTEQPGRYPPGLDATWWELLKKHVSEQGGGVAFIAGPAYTSRLIVHPQAAALRTLLPITIKPDQSFELEGLLHPPTRPWPMRFTPEAEHHPSLHWTHATEQDQKIWEALPGVYWCFPAGGVKPGARVLVEHGDPGQRSAEGGRPFIVAGQYGQGRTFYIGGDSTWRWRGVGHDSEYFDRFWMQTLRYLVEGRRLTGARRGSITLSAETFPVGTSIAMTARLYDASYAPLAEAVVPAQLRPAGQPPVNFTFTAVPAQPGRYEASQTVRHTGSHEIVIDLGADTLGQRVSVNRRFQVEAPRIEFTDTRLDRTRLQAMAERSGGKYFEIHQARDLPKAIPDRTQVHVIRSRPLELWDTYWTLVLLAGLLITEWLLRKRHRFM